MKILNLSASFISFSIVSPYEVPDGTPRHKARKIMRDGVMHVVIQPKQIVDLTELTGLTDDQLKQQTEFMKILYGPVTRLQIIKKVSESDPIPVPVVKPQVVVPPPPVKKIEPVEPKPLKAVTYIKDEDFPIPFVPPVKHIIKKPELKVEPEKVEPKKPEPKKVVSKKPEPKKVEPKKFGKSKKR